MSGPGRPKTKHRIECPNGICDANTTIKDLCQDCKVAYYRFMKERTRSQVHGSYKPHTLPPEEYAAPLSEVGRELGISSERARQIEERALAKIHNSPKRRQLLEGYIPDDH